jgi:hypothetical protein
MEILKMSKSLLDLMPKEERDKALERARKRQEKNRARKGLDVSPEIFTVAKAGIYFGWEAVMAIRRGYTIDPDLDEDGNLFYKKHILELDEVMVFLEGADKVRYSQLIEQVHAGVVSGSFKSNSQSFDGALKPFTDRAEVVD